MLEFDLGIPPQEQKELVVSLRYWMMHDLAFTTRYSQEFVDNMKKKYPAKIAQYIFTYAWNGISSAFLKRFSVEPIIMH